MSDEQPPLVPPGGYAAPGQVPPVPPAPPGVAGRPPSYAAGDYAAPAAPLHKPGTVPLRPLLLSDMFDAAFTTVRRNPRATIGMGALVSAGFMLLPIIGTLVLALAGGLDDAIRNDPTSTEPGMGTYGIYAASSIAGVFGLLANVVVAGLVVPVVTRAAVGEKVDTATAWRTVRGRLLPLVLLALLELLVAVLVIAVTAALGGALGYLVGGVVGAVVLAILLGLLGALGAVGLHARYFQLGAPSLVVERRSVLGAVGRAGRLSRGSFWRILGILLLTSVLTGIIGQVISVPFTLIGSVLGVTLPAPTGSVVLLISSNLAAIVTGAVVAPFTGTVAVLQYLDQRFRREGFDIDLITYVQRGSR